ncbi:MAG: histidine kinase [Verrucomicrobiota bacterium]
MRTLRLRSRLIIALGCLMLVALIGYGDYREGYENSMLLLYLVPIAVATWYDGVIVGVIIAALCVAVAVLSDVKASIPTPGIWNVASSFLYYVVFAVLLSRWHNLLNNMHRRVEERTVDLQREIVARKALERQIAQVTEHERRRLGRELHDSLCQHLTGTALKAQTVVTQLGGSDNPAIENARRVVSLVDRGIDIARDIARGLFSSELEGEGLIEALDVLAKTTSHERQIECRFHHTAQVTMPATKATQLYWIAREAVTNAVTHANPTRIEIGLTRAGDDIELLVEDNGTGMAHSGNGRNGIGLQVMMQRAELAGGSLSTGRSDYGGAAVRCVVSHA